MDLDFNVMDYAPGNKPATDPHEEKQLMKPGKYILEIIESSDEISAAGNRYAKLKLSVVDGPHKDTWVWDNLNLYHPKEEVRDLARKILSDITHACGLKDSPKDTSELHYKPMFVQIDVDPETEKENSPGEFWPAKNVVKGYSPLNESPKKTKPKFEIDMSGPADMPDISNQEPVKDDIPF